MNAVSVIRGSVTLIFFPKLLSYRKPVERNWQALWPINVSRSVVDGKTAKLPDTGSHWHPPNSMRLHRRRRKQVTNHKTVFGSIVRLMGCVISKRSMHKLVRCEIKYMVFAFNFVVSEYNLKIIEKALLAIWMRQNLSNHGNVSRNIQLTRLRFQNFWWKKGNRKQ